VLLFVLSAIIVVLILLVIVVLSAVFVIRVGRLVTSTKSKRANEYLLATTTH